MGTASPELMTQFTMRDLELSNRIVLAPMTRARAGQERLANEIMAEYYQLRADAEQSKTQLENIRLTAAEDLTWALVNSPAFLFNH